VETKVESKLESKLESKFSILRCGVAGSLYQGSKNVVALTATNFPTEAASSVYLIHFWNRSSRSHAVADAVKGVAAAVSASRLFKVGAVDCGKHNDLCAGREALQVRRSYNLKYVYKCVYLFSLVFGVRGWEV
jgi:hypothetical protein